VGVEVVAWLEQTLRARRLQASVQAVRREVFESGLPPNVPVRAVAEQKRDVHDLKGLSAIGTALMGE
jgi:hypothetical protein